MKRVNPTKTRIAKLLNTTITPLTATDIATVVERKKRTVSSILKELVKDVKIGVFVNPIDNRRKYYGSKDRRYSEYYMVTINDTFNRFRHF